MSNSMLAAVHDAARSDQPDAGTARAAAEEVAGAIATAAGKAKDEGKAEGVKEGSGAARADAAAIVEMCAAAGFPGMAAALIREGASTDQARSRVEGAAEIKAAVDLARKSCPAIDAGQADKYLAAGLTLDQARADLFAKMTALQSPEINPSHAGAPAKPASAAWDKAVAKVNGPVPG